MSFSNNFHLGSRIGFPFLNILKIEIQVDLVTRRRRAEVSRYDDDSDSYRHPPSLVGSSSSYTTLYPPHIYTYLFPPFPGSALKTLTPYFILHITAPPP